MGVGAVPVGGVDLPLARVESTAVVPFSAAAMRQAAGAITEVRPPIGMAACEAATEAGGVITQDEINHRKLLFQVARLVALLSPQALAVGCACTVAQLAGLGPERVAHHLVTRHPRKWKWSTIRDVHNAWARLLLWLQRHGVEHDGFELNAVDLGDFLDEADANARAKGARSVAQEATEAREAAAAADASGFRRAGAHSAQPRESRARKRASRESN